MRVFLSQEFIPHNAAMPSRRGPRCAALLTSALLLFALLPPAWATNARPATVEAGYVPALAAADHFLQAWQSGDVENGMALLSSHARQAATSEEVEKFFQNNGSSAYEIGRGKLLKRGRYEFPVVLVSGGSKNGRVRRRFSSIVIVDTGGNDWAVDKLP
jgi:hypothetical protein